MLHSSAHQRSASSTSHDSGYVSGSTSASAPTALTGASSCSPNHSRLSTDTSRLLSSKLFKGWVRTYDPVERCGIIQARTGTTYELDGADVVSPVDRSHVREGLAVSFEARLEQGAFRAEAIQVTWPVTLLQSLDFKDSGLQHFIPLEAVTLEGMILSRQRLELRDPGYCCAAIIPYEPDQLTITKIDESSIAPGFPITVAFHQSAHGTFDPTSLCIDWRAVLHSYTLKMSEDGECALRQCNRKLSGGQAREKTVRPWLGVISQTFDERGGLVGIVLPVEHEQQGDRYTVKRKDISFDLAHLWPEGQEWYSGMHVLCWSRSGEHKVSVMMKQPERTSKSWESPALAVA